MFSSAKTETLEVLWGRLKLIYCNKNEKAALHDTEAAPPFSAIPVRR